MPPRRANVLIGALTLLAIANCLTHLLVIPDALHTSNLIVLFVVMGLVFVSRAWFYPLVLIAGVCWLLLAFFRPLADVQQWGWILLFTGFASALLMEQRRRSVLAVLKVDRLGIWLFEDGNSQLRLCDLFDSSDGSHSDDELITRSDYPGYFEALSRDRFIAATDARSDPRTSCLGS